MVSEISLRELIEMVFRRKKGIAITTIICMLLSVVYSFLIFKPTYEATAILLANPINGNQNNTSGDIENIINNLGNYPGMTIDTYKEAITIPSVLNNTINELNLTNDHGEPLYYNDLAKRISTSLIDGTNLINITISDRNPEKSALIANSIANNFIKYISESTKKVGEQAVNVIEEQLHQAESDLEIQAKSLQDYQIKSPNIDQMKLEITSLNNQITTYKSNLINIEKQISSDKETLKALNVSVSPEDGVDTGNIMINLPINSGDSNQEIIQININDSNKLKNSLMTIKITEIETRLVENLSDQAAIISEISDMESKSEELQASLTEQEYKYNTLQRNYALAEQTYNAYLDRQKEAVVSAASDIGQSLIIVSSQAVIPIDSIGFGKLFYIVIGTFLGFILGIFIALFKEYWKSSSRK